MALTLAVFVAAAFAVWRWTSTPAVTPPPPPPPKVAEPPKPSGPMTYVVEKGANTIPTPAKRSHKKKRPTA